MVNVVLFYGSNFISPSYTSIMVSSHFIIRRLTQFAASAWLLAATHRKYFGKKSVLSWEGSSALQSGGRWVMISTGVCVSWQHHSAQKVMNCVTGSPPCPLIGQHNPFKCSDWPSIFLQLCYSVSQSCCCPICLHWLAFSSTIVTINIWCSVSEYLLSWLRLAAVLSKVKWKVSCFSSLRKRNCEERSRQDVYRDFASDVKLYFIRLMLK